MLGEDSDSHQESSVKVLNVQNVDKNVSAENSVKNENTFPFQCSDSLTVNAELDVSNNAKELCDIDKEKYIIPEGYQFLPEHLFQFNGILPPLVSSSWLKFLKSDEEESGEDSIPLSKLQKMMRKKKRKKKTDELTALCNSAELNTCKQKSVKRRKKQNAETEYSPIKRRRGRPKKQPAEKTTNSVENEFINEETEPFWNDDSDSLNQEIQGATEVDINCEKQDSNLLIVKYNEHDYFKPVENKNVEEIEVEKTKEKKAKKKPAVQGIQTGGSKVSFPCLECGKSFSAASTLKCHQRIHNGTLLICPECHKGFVSKYLLKCHMRIHNGDLFMCHKCGRGFTTAELLKVHSRAHTGDRPFVCNICGKSFPTSSNMLQHKQIHNSEKKFLCSQCGSSFVQKRCLDYHMLTHAEKKNICNVCGKLWARKSDLIEHMRVHTGVKPYCCSVCPQKFSQASSLKRHQLVHMDIKPIQCVTCSKMFKCQEYYKRHLRKHKKEDYLYNDI